MQQSLMQMVVKMSDGIKLEEEVLTATITNVFI
jgi:hypothetical protein